MNRLPPWIRKLRTSSKSLHSIKSGLRREGLNTVCEEARCPNISECFGRCTATYMIMGNICTRHCGFCDVSHGTPKPLDAGEPNRIADHAKSLRLRHVVLTSVTRDDLPDGGAAQFASAIRATRQAMPSSTIEVLTPDFQGSRSSIETVCMAKPDVFNHNLETVERLTPAVRSNASYNRSLDVLSLARQFLSQGIIKSGLMVGLGETVREIKLALKDLKSVGCDIVTIGQYLRPSRSALPVVEYIHPDIFEELAKSGELMGIGSVFAGPLVRSSYHAEKVMFDRKQNF